MALWCPPDPLRPPILDPDYPRMPVCIVPDFVDPSTENGPDYGSRCGVSVAASVAAAVIIVDRDGDVTLVSEVVATASGNVRCRR